MSFIFFLTAYFPGISDKALIYYKCHTNQTKNNKTLLKHCNANPQNLESKSGKKIIRPFEKGFKLNIE